MADSSDPITGASFQRVAAFSGDQSKVVAWKDLITFKVSDSIIKDLATRNIKVQNIEDAIGDLNIDLYQIQIDKFPKLPGASAPATPEEFLYFAGTNLNTLVDTKISTFYPLDASLDDVKWKSHSPIGAVIRIDIPIFRAPTSGDNILGPWTGKSIGDNAAVVCSESDGTHWRLSTLSIGYSVSNSMASM
jgi:hypothetical protein